MIIDVFMEVYLRDRRTLFLIATLIALLLHIVLFLTPWNKLFPQSPSWTPIQTQSISPKELQKRTQNNLKQMVELDPSLAPSDTAPHDAHFASDQNRTVEKETRARHQENLPKFQGKTGEGRFVPYGIGLPRAATTAPQSTTPQADQFIEAPDLEWGEQNLLSTVESQYFSFFQRLRAIHAPIWNQEFAARKDLVPTHPATAQAIVYLNPESGAYIGVDFINNPPEWLTDCIRRAWVRTIEIAHPPKGLMGPDGRIHIPINYYVGL